jgi:hypothetical protein
MAVPCPWGLENIDLHDKILSKMEKDWIAGEIISKRIKVKEMHARYNICVRRLREYAYRTKKGIVLHGKNGRPRLLDEISFATIKEAITSDINITDMSLKQYIKREFVATRNRRFPDLVGRRWNGVQSRSVKRYMNLFRHHRQELIDSTNSNDHSNINIDNEEEVNRIGGCLIN